MADLPKPPFQNKVTDSDGYMDRGWLSYLTGLANSLVSGWVSSLTGVPNRIKVTGTPAAPIVDIDPAYIASVQQGGTGQNTYTLGDTLFASGPAALSRLPGSTQNIPLVMTQTGTGSASAPPAWMTRSQLLQVSNVLDYGAKGDGVTDDTTALTNWLASIVAVKGVGYAPKGIYYHTNTLNIPAGVCIYGDGWGGLPTSAPTSAATVFAYHGTGTQMSVNGSATRLEKFILQDVNNTAAIGLLLNADTNILESNYYRNILCYGHKAGRAKWMKAANNGYIAYNVFENFRVRDAKYGIEITAPAGAGGDNAFVNSNTWRGGAMSGSNGIFTNCLLVHSGQDNNFLDVTIEPYDSVDGHIWVRGGSINMNGLVLEARDQLSKYYTGSPTVNTPHALRFDVTTIRSKVFGSGSGSSYSDLGNNDIRMESSKAPQKGLNSPNILKNCIFKNINSPTVQDWSISGGGVTVAQVDFESKYKDHFTLKVTVPAGILCNVRQNLTDTELLARFSAAPLTFGAWVNFSGDPLKTVVAATVSDNTGTTTGAPHTGDATYQWKGMSKQITFGPTDMSVAMSIDNTAGTGAAIVYITVPCAILGWWLPAPGATPMTNAGGIVDGLFSLSFGKDKSSASSLVLAKEGNTHLITGTTTITQINKLVTDPWYPKGTRILLVFQSAGCQVTSSADISLQRPFTSTAYGTLEVISNGDGTWTEIDRNLTSFFFSDPNLLGSVAGNYQQIAEFQSLVGNTFKERIWLYRNANGSDFTTARLHKAVSVDTSFATPRTDTRAWEEIDPNAGTRHWGHQDKTRMQLDANGLQLKVGGDTAFGRAIMVISSNTTTVGNTSTGETDLDSFALPADSLNRTGDAVHLYASGSFAANANTKRIRAYFGTTVLFDTTALAFNGTTWSLELLIVRTGSASQKIMTRFDANDAVMVATPYPFTKYTTAAIDLTLSETIKLTGQAPAGASNDIVQEINRILFEPAP